MVFQIMFFFLKFEPNIYLLFLKLRKGAFEHDDGSKLVGPICNGQQRWLKPLRLHRAARIGFDPLAMLSEADAIIIYTRNMRKPILYIYTHYVKLEFDVYYSWEYAGKTNIVYTCSSSTLQYIWSDKSIWSFKSTSATELGHGKSTSARSKKTHEFCFSRLRVWWPDRHMDVCAWICRGSSGGPQYQVVNMGGSINGDIPIIPNSWMVY